MQASLGLAARYKDPRQTLNFKGCLKFEPYIYYEPKSKVSNQPSEQFCILAKKLLIP